MKVYFFNGLMLEVRDGDVLAFGPENDEGARYLVGCWRGKSGDDFRAVISFVDFLTRIVRDVEDEDELAPSIQ